MVEKQPNSRICFVCGVDPPHRTRWGAIVLDGAPSACTWPSTPTTKDAASPAPGPSPSTRATPAICMGESYRPYWMSQLKLVYSLAFPLYD
jgi:hypothetical protein